MARTKSHEQDPPGGVDKVEQILQGAMQEFLSNGYAATSMDRVAGTAGVSKATVYSRFQDKEGLFVALVQRLAQDKIMPLQVLEDAPPALALPQLARTVLDQIHSKPEFLNFLRLVIGESGRFPHLAQAFIHNLGKVGIERLTAYFQSRPELKLADPEATARIYIGTLVYFTITQEMLYGKDIVPMDRERLIKALMNLILPEER